LCYIADMKYQDDDKGRTRKKQIRECEKVNAVEYVKKDECDEQKKLEKRVKVIDDRCIFDSYVLL